MFETESLPADVTDVAPDGSEVRVLLGLKNGGLAHFTLGAGQTSRAVAHHTVEEIWYVLEGEGEMWRSLGDQESVVSLRRGVCLTIPVGTRFQFRATTPEALEVVGVTMPLWPGPGEAYFVAGAWESTFPPAP